MVKKKTHKKEVLILYSEHKSSQKVAEIISKKYGVPMNSTLPRKIRRWISEDQETKKVESEQFKDAQKRKPEKQSKYYIITAAQNATPIHKQFFDNIEAYAKKLKASIEVIPIRYKNPTSVFVDKDHEWWDERTTPYLIASRHRLNKNLKVLADIKTQPTASNPLSGMAGLTGVESSIIAHPRQHLEFVPTLDAYPKKVLVSTGVVTTENYTDSAAGKKGEFHHTLGFVIVEIKSNSTFFIRQVSAKKDGSFIDLDFLVESGKVSKEKSVIDACIFGDLHIRKHNDEAMKCAYGMLNRFKPKNLIIHDIAEGESVNHHLKNKPFELLDIEKRGKTDVEEEIKESIDFLNSVLEYNPVVVRSNHDKFFDRWLEETDWRKDRNKYTYLKYAKLKADGMLENGIIPYEIKKTFGNKVKCLSENDSFIVAGVELGQHGHMGSSGSRGSVEQFKRLNIKMVIGHGHSPCKKDGVTMVGTLTELRMGYNIGFSKWQNSCGIINKHGKTQLLLIIEGDYSTLK